MKKTKRASKSGGKQTDMTVLYYYVNRYGSVCYDIKQYRFLVCVLSYKLNYPIQCKRCSNCYTQFLLCTIWSWSLTQIVCTTVFVVLWPGTLGWYGQTQIWLHRSAHLSSALELHLPLMVDQAADSLDSEKKRPALLQYTVHLIIKHCFELHNPFTYHYVLREEVVTEWAIVEDNFIECGLGQLNHLTMVVSAVFVLADHFLSLL